MFLCSSQERDLKRDNCCLFLHPIVQLLFFYSCIYMSFILIKQMLKIMKDIFVRTYFRPIARSEYQLINKMVKTHTRHNTNMSTQRSQNEHVNITAKIKTCQQTSQTTEKNTFNKMTKTHTKQNNMTQNHQQSGQATHINRTVVIQIHQQNSQDKHTHDRSGHKLTNRTIMTQIPVQSQNGKDTNISTER